MIELLARLHGRRRQWPWWGQALYFVGIPYVALAAYGATRPVGRRRSWFVASGVLFGVFAIAVVLATHFTNILDASPPPVFLTFAADARDEEQVKAIYEACTEAGMPLAHWLEMKEQLDDVLGWPDSDKFAYNVAVAKTDERSLDAAWCVVTRWPRRG